MINRVVLVGRLTRDPELKNSASGTGSGVCTFTVAVDNRQKSNDGTKTASFIPCVAFANTAENVSKYAKKGLLVGVEGRLQQRSYDRRDGTKANVIEVLCDNVSFLEPKATNEVENNMNDDTPTFDDVNKESDAKNLDSLDLPDEDLPF